jgi:hypothetical protein
MVVGIAAADIVSPAAAAGMDGSFWAWCGPVMSDLGKQGAIPEELPKHNVATPVPVRQDRRMRRREG